MPSVRSSSRANLVKFFTDLNTPSRIVMKLVLALLALFAAGASAAPFASLPSSEDYGSETTAWRFASSLSPDATGTIELCYIEEGSAERVIGRVGVRPFRSSAPKRPELHLLFAKAESEGKKKVVLIVSYGIRSGAFIADLPALVTHPLAISGAPVASPTGDYALLGFGDRGVSVKPDGAMEAQGRLFLRYVGTP